MSREAELFGAVSLGVTERARALMTSSWLGLKPGLSPNLKNAQGFTLLHIAANDGHTEMVRLLIEKGAELEARADSGFTPLHCAALMGRAEVVRELLRTGADANARDVDEMTPISAAIMEGEPAHLEVVKALIDAGAELNGEYSLEGRTFTPLGTALFMDNSSMIDLLQQAGATADRRPPKG